MCAVAVYRDAERDGMDVREQRFSRGKQNEGSPLRQYIMEQESSGSMTIRGMEDLTSRFAQYELRQSGPLQLTTGSEAVQPKPVTMDHEVDPSNVADARTNAKKEAEYHKAVQRWKELSAAKKWDEVIANLDVYAHSGQKLEADPRRTEQ